MLKQLKVQNFALIQHANLDFNAGYTVITGETGSGKSILLQALNLILGDRADFKIIGPSSDKAVVEAIFMIDSGEFASFFTENDIDPEQETIIRREITNQGKSRAFINDTPVQLTVLKSFSERLISIHSQYNTLDLKRKEFQLQTLDILAGTRDLQHKYVAEFEHSKQLTRSLESEKEELEKLIRDKDYNDFQLRELEELNLSNTNFTALEEQLNRLENATEIQQLANGISTGIGSEGAVIDQLQTIKQLASKLVKIDAAHIAIEQRIQSVIIELKDLDTELSHLINQEFDEQKKYELTALLDKYNHVLIKHRCSTEDELKQLLHQLQTSNSDTEKLSSKIAGMEQELSVLNKALVATANQLHEKRVNAVSTIAQRITTSLTDLKLPDTQLVFQLEQQEKLTAFGNSSLTLLFSANKGVAPIEIEKAASGGELSRVMLALQKLISEKIQLPTIFFDEIDTGVSGDVAQKIGQLLQEMGKTMQLFAISHLPQVAAKAQHHFKVEKSAQNNLVQTQITPLSNEKRVEEIARLMSGEIINEAAISNAKALMS